MKEQLSNLCARLVVGFNLAYNAVRAKIRALLNITLGQILKYGGAGAILISALVYSYLHVYGLGHDRGVLEGRCEIVCNMFNIDYGFLDDDDSCWCDLGDENYMALPFEIEK